MRKLTSRQLDRTSEILGNIAVAWFTAGAISPFFIKPKTIFDLLSYFLLGLIMAGFFFTWSLLIAGEIKK